jgi:hypothetical protein
LIATTRFLLFLANPLLLLTRMTVLRSGDVRYDKRTNEEVRLVKRLVASQGQSIWVVLYPDLTMKAVSDLRGKFTKDPQGEPRRIRPLSKAEWSRLQEEASDIHQAAPDSLGITGVADVEDTGSEPDTGGASHVESWWQTLADAKLVSVRSSILTLMSVVGMIVSLVAAAVPELGAKVYGALAAIYGVLAAAGPVIHQGLNLLGGTLMAFAKALVRLSIEDVVGTVAALVLLVLGYYVVSLTGLWRSRTQPPPGGQLTDPAASSGLTRRRLRRLPQHRPLATLSSPAW